MLIPPMPSPSTPSRPPGIAALVSSAQSREAPVQRLADAVAGRFCYGVMAAAAATFLFWLTAGAALWPHVLDDVGGWAAVEASYHSHGGEEAGPARCLVTQE